MTPLGPGDDDGDGIPDVCDLCPQHGKPFGDGRQLLGGAWRQPDADGDGLADACDDQCPSNPAQPDLVCCNPAAPGQTCNEAGATYPWSNRCFAIAPQTASMASIACPAGTKGLLDVYWAHVQGVSQLDAAQANCNNGVPDCYRPRSNSYAAGFFGVSGGKTIFEVPTVGFNSCFWCLKEPCPHCLFWKEIGNLLVQPATPSQPAKVVLHSNERDVDLTSSFAPGLAEALLDRTSRWVTAAEREHLPQGGAMLASLAGDGTRVDDVFAVQDGVVSAIQQRSPAAKSSARGAPHPAARRSFGAVLSATELFVFGGTALLTGQPVDAAALWIHDWERDSWHAATLRGTIPGKVLAATFRVEDRSIYAIDEVPGSGKPLARLLRIRLADLRSSVVATFSRSPQLDRVDLVAAPDGRLLLVGSFSAPKLYRAALFQPGNARIERVLWTVAGWGQLGAEPSLTENGLTLPLRSPQASTPLTNQFIATPELPGAPTFGMDKCL